MEEVAYGSRRQRKELTPQAIAADAVGISTIIVSTIALILGETTKIFSWIKDPHAGVAFICDYIAAPVFPFIRWALPRMTNDWMTVILYAVSVSLFAAFAYGIVAYIIVRAVVKAKKARGS